MVSERRHRRLTSLGTEDPLARDTMRSVRRCFSTERERSFGPQLRVLVLLVTAVTSLGAMVPDQQKGNGTTHVAVRAAREGCIVDVDGGPTGKTGAQGELLVTGVDPGEHYVHVRCPGEAETSTLVVVPATGPLALAAGPAANAPSAAQPSPLDVAERRLELRRLVAKAIDLRSAGRIDDAVKSLRRAASLDPDNSDLHRELGITFLMTHEWARARVEMLEAIRHDPASPDAHSGLGYALERMGDLDGALKEYRVASRIEPDDVSYRQHYLEVLAKLAARQTEKKNKK